MDPALYKGINNYVPTIGIEAKRGCALNCAYCVYPQLQGSRLRGRPPAAVVDEMELLHKGLDFMAEHHQEIAGMIIEPLVRGAAGMHIQSLKNCIEGN
jgi:L-lysine 2,3-aminomutase